MGDDGKMKVRDLMKEMVETISLDESAVDAWARMRRRGIRHLVVTRGGQVAGVVSDRDLGGARGEALRKGRKVGDVMSAHVVCTSPETTVRQAANLMRGRTIGCLPVVDDGRLVGIITVSDLLDLIGKGIESPVPNGRSWSVVEEKPSAAKKKTAPKTTRKPR